MASHARTVPDIKTWGSRLLFVLLVLAQPWGGVPGLAQTPPTAAVVCEVNLMDGAVTCSDSQAIQVLEGPRDRMALIKLTLDPQKNELKRAVIEVFYGGKPEGFTVNIGDSQSNNGYAGDGASQTHDSEAQVAGDVFTVYGSDLMPETPGTGKALTSVKEFAGEEDILMFEVSNQRISWKNSRGKEGAIDSPYLFALAGQPDQEGPVNHDLYVGLNRVVGGAFRSGKGVVRARFSLYHQ